MLAILSVTHSHPWTKSSPASGKWGNQSLIVTSIPIKVTRIDACMLGEKVGVGVIQYLVNYLNLTNWQIGMDISFERDFKLGQLQKLRQHESGAIISKWWNSEQINCPYTKAPCLGSDFWVRFGSITPELHFLPSLSGVHFRRGATCCFNYSGQYLDGSKPKQTRSDST